VGSRSRCTSSDARSCRRTSPRLSGSAASLPCCDMTI
jgi:hypothetical protein